MLYFIVEPHRGEESRHTIECDNIGAYNRLIKRSPYTSFPSQRFYGVGHSVDMSVNERQKVNMIWMRRFRPTNLKDKTNFQLQLYRYTDFH